jgi:hypothetical protein
MSVAILTSVAGEGLRSAPPATESGADLAVLLRHERGRATQPLLEVLLDRRSYAEGQEVRDAAYRLVKRHAPYALDLAAPAAALIREAGDQRSQRLFVAWRLRPDGRSQAQLGEEEGVSASRVGQVIQTAERRIRAALAASPAPLPWAVRSFRLQLGAVTTQGHLSGTLTRLGAKRAPAAELLPWLAGPYRAIPHHPGWLAVDPRQLAARTQACAGADGGVRRLADVQAELADLGIEASQLVPWLRANGVTVIHDLVVLLGGPLREAVERVLDAHGAPRTVKEIAADLAAGGRTVQSGALEAALRQRRFARARNGGIGLAVWPPEQRPATGTRRPRRPSGDPGPHTDREQKTRELGVEGPGTGSAAQLWLWVRVDAGVLRGSEAPVPVALVQGLGMAPPSRRTFASRWGPVTLAYDGSQPTRGSVRAVALAAGARSDDTLLLGFSRSSHDVAVEVRRGSVLTSDADATSTGVALYPEIATGGTH